MKTAYPEMVTADRAVCEVTVYDRTRGNRTYPPRGEPTVDGRLCAKHLADKERLS